MKNDVVVVWKRMGPFQEKYLKFLNYRGVVYEEKRLCLRNDNLEKFSTRLLHGAKLHSNKAAVLGKRCFSVYGSPDTLFRCFPIAFQKSDIEWLIFNTVSVALETTLRELDGPLVEQMKEAPAVACTPNWGSVRSVRSGSPGKPCLPSHRRRRIGNGLASQE